jgi:hypothetical protein
MGPDTTIVVSGAVEIRSGRDPERRRVAGCQTSLFELLTNPVRK